RPSTTRKSQRGENPATSVVESKIKNLSEALTAKFKVFENILSSQELILNVDLIVSSFNALDEIAAVLPDLKTSVKIISDVFKSAIFSNKLTSAQNSSTLVQNFFDINQNVVKSTWYQQCSGLQKELETLQTLRRKYDEFEFLSKTKNTIKQLTKLNDDTRYKTYTLQDEIDRLNKKIELVHQDYEEEIKT
ncbi:hypothetical protein AKO1_000789, partial [Acrasis kona]